MQEINVGHAKDFTLRSSELPESAPYFHGSDTEATSDPAYTVYTAEWKIPNGEHRVTTIVARSDKPNEARVWLDCLRRFGCVAHYARLTVKDENIAEDVRTGNLDAIISKAEDKVVSILAKEAREAEEAKMILSAQGNPYAYTRNTHPSQEPLSDAQRQALTAGNVVLAHSRGNVRKVVVLKVTRTGSVRIGYTTPASPESVTRYTVKTDEKIWPIG